MRLESLHIKNYKLFKDLEIPKLGQVNLITGKNNTGKTILLEALRIWASEGDASVINNIIWKRGDWDESSMWETYSSLYHNRDMKKELVISKINENSKIIFIPDYYGRGMKDLKEFSIKYFERPRTQKLMLKIWSSDSGKGYVDSKEYPNDSAIYIPASIDFDNKFLWEKIVKERKKVQVIKVLQTIDSKINEIEIIDKQALIGLENTPSLILLKNFGEGLNRLLTIAMALVSAKDNLLLIDEVDTGLHYSVLEKLWEIIFEFSTQLNTQVFVTTHSGDCVDAFSTVANQERFKGVGNYFRLSRKEEGVVAVEYDIDELEMALESNIETR